MQQQVNLELKLMDKKTTEGHQKIVNIWEDYYKKTLTADMEEIEQLEDESTISQEQEEYCQNGFRSGRSTINGLYILEQIYQKTIENIREVHTIFVSASDLKKLMEELNGLKIPKKLCELLKMTPRQ